MVKKTVAELNKDVEILLEKFEMLKSNHEERINILKSDHEERIKSLEAKLAILENCSAPSTTEEVNISTIKCKECGVLLEKRSDLKIHIQAVHPKQYNCNLCAEIFETSLAFELHLRIHAAKKDHKCETCGQTFYMKWRLQKHMKQHELTNVKYCHFFNNNKFCRFQELGCMFKHDHAPRCKREVCRSKMFQFKHEFFQENPSETTANNKFVTDLSDMEKQRVYPCDKCSFVSKTEAYIEVHRASKYKQSDLDTVQQADNSLKAEEKDDTVQSNLDM
jgi:hypothetical protein